MVIGCSIGTRPPSLSSRDGSELRHATRFQSRRHTISQGPHTFGLRGRRGNNRPASPSVQARMTTTLADLRLGLRGLRRSPLFATVAILSLALGIGANTAIFTLIDQILLRKLPVAAPEELVMLHQQGPNMGSNAGSRMHSYPLYQDLQKRAEPLADVLCRRLVDASLS